MRTFNLHLVSDATGETVVNIARACVSQFDDVHHKEHLWVLVRTQRQLEMVFIGIKANPGLVMYTLVEECLRRRLEEYCRENQLPCVSVLDPLITALGNLLGIESQSQPGRQHVLDAEYFLRMDAMEFTLAHDDGLGARDLHEADVVLVGVSRSSKSPTCIHLATRGVKAANVPFVPGCPLPPELDWISTPLIVGLTNDPTHLIHIRRSRMRHLSSVTETNYVDPDIVREEVMEARRYFCRKRWPVIDVSRRSIEETAAEILMLLAHHRNPCDDGMNFS
ncbi:MAG: pyruvate, water dikinase regulatory protein [Rhodospirillaceae bacterium]